ncbi:hypothetical protein JCM19046_1416 [Bacillus sp. JCM 19046]|nr:hypothetical protein JCM19045_591 [Bacillus sp. JCM 19045]GAF16949.1 hypothetical protein JCM19046_1416 [Bacillus sp. JCM 19046]
MKRIVLFVNLILLTLMLSPLTASAAPADEAAQQQAITDMLSTVSQEKTVLEPEHAATAFLATLPDDQKERTLLELKPETLVKWSNLPATAENRNGVSLGEFSEESLKAGLRLVRSVLSPEGFEQASEIIKADAYLKTTTVYPQFKWGADLYFLSIHGQPTEADPWFVQFSGHHLAETIGFHTEEAAVTPQFTGLEPRGFHWNNQPYAPFEDRIAAAQMLMQSLNDDQRTQSKLKQTYSDVLVGPEKDGAFPKQEGLALSALNNHQQAHVKKLVLSWITSVPKQEQQALMDAYFSEDALAQTTLAWSSSTEITTQGAYIRLDGPRMLIELSSREGAAKKEDFHLHTIWRDKLADYGSLLPNTE